MDISPEAPLATQVKAVIKDKWDIFFLSILIISMGQLSLGLIFPLLPWISESFHISQRVVEWIIIGYLMGYGPSQLIYGPLSYIYGRRVTLLVGLFISILGLVIIFLFSDKFYCLVIGRFIQGVGSGCESVIARSILHDSYKNKFFLTAVTGLSIISAFIPIFSPIVGGLVNHHFGWVAVFNVLLIYVILGYLILVLYLPETLKTSREKISFIPIILYYRDLLTDRYFLSYAIMGWVNWALVIFCGALSPFIFERQFGLSSESYAYWTIIPAVAFLLSSFLCFILRKSYGTHHIVFIAPLIQFIVGVLFVIYPLNIFVITFGFIGISIAQAFIYPCSQSLLLVPYSNKFGTVSALSGSGQMISAALFILFFIYAGFDHIRALAMLILLTALIGLILALIGRSSKASAMLNTE